MLTLVGIVLGAWVLGGVVMVAVLYPLLVISGEDDGHL
jgi:hypothetical protein